MIVSPPLLQICRQFDSRYTPHLIPNTGQGKRFALCQLGTQSNLMLMDFRIFCINYSIDVISASNAGMSAIQHAIYSTLAAKYSARKPVSAMSTQISVKTNVIVLS